MKLWLKRATCFLLSAVVLALLAGPTLARVGIKCPYPLLTITPPGLAGVPAGLQLSYNQNDPRISTNPNCRNVNDPLFTQKCQVDIDPITGQPSGKTVNPVFLNGSSIAFGNPSTSVRLARFAFLNLTTHVRCRSITCGDGHVLMGDRDRSGNSDFLANGDTFIFGFRDVTGVPADQVLPMGFAGAQHLAPTMVADQGEELWLTLTNAGFRERPDLVDAHTVHYHGFPNAGSAFDGEPMASFGVNIGSSLTYYYKNEEPGTYMWHCHVEAAEHMQMGMLGELYVNPKQAAVGAPGLPAPVPGSLAGYAYNDCTTPAAVPAAFATVPPPTIAADPMCGATRYDFLKPLEVTSFDPDFHHHDQTYQPVRFDLMNDTYPMFNGRGYPDTVVRGAIVNNGTPFDPAHLPSQPHNAVLVQYDASGTPTPVTVTAGQRILIRMPSLSTVDFYTVTVLGIPFQVVGEGARLLRGPAPAAAAAGGVFNPGYGLSTIYRTGSVTIGGGEAYDLLLDTTGVPAGTYFMYTTNLNGLNNNGEDFGGMMTEIVVN